MRHTWRWVAIAVVVVAVGLGVNAARSSGTNAAGNAPAVSTMVSGSHDDPGSADGQMIAAHQQMTEQMRVNATPAMVAMMNTDPMWQMMRDPVDIAKQNEHQREIKMMLGLGG